MTAWRPAPAALAAQLVLGAALAGALLLLAPTIAVLPAALLLFVLPAAVWGWTQAQSLLRESLSRPLTLAWSEELPAPKAAWYGEVTGLGYEPAGVLWNSGAAGRRAEVFIHRALPAYLIVETPPSGNVGYPRTAVRHLESFFEGGARLSTSSASGFRLFTTLLPGGAVRLLQYRWGGTATALDGQHLGTLKAWTSGGRVPLPATREALLEYLEADRLFLCDLLAPVGWIPVPAFLRSLRGDGPGTLRF